MIMRSMELNKKKFQKKSISIEILTNFCLEINEILLEIMK